MRGARFRRKIKRAMSVWTLANFIPASAGIRGKMNLPTSRPIPPLKERAHPSCFGIKIVGTAGVEVMQIWRKFPSGSPEADGSG